MRCRNFQEKNPQPNCLALGSYQEIRHAFQLEWINKYIIMCSQKIIAQQHKQFYHRLFTVHRSVFVPSTSRPVPWHHHFGGQLSWLSPSFRTILNTKISPCCFWPTRISFVGKPSLSRNRARLFWLNTRFTRWGARWPCCPVRKPQRGQWPDHQSLEIPSSLSRRGREENPLQEREISSHPHGNWAKKRLSCLGMGSWAESYRTQKKPRRNKCHRDLRPSQC